MDAPESGAGVLQSRNLPLPREKSAGFIQNSSGNTEVDGGSFFFFIINLLVYFGRVTFPPSLTCAAPGGIFPHSSWCCWSQQEHLDHNFLSPTGFPGSQLPILGTQAPPEPGLCCSLCSSFASLCAAQEKLQQNHLGNPLRFLLSFGLLGDTTCARHFGSQLAEAAPPDPDVPKGWERNLSCGKHDSNQASRGMWAAGHQRCGLGKLEEAMDGRTGGSSQVKFGSSRCELLLVPILSSIQVGSGVLSIPGMLLGGSSPALFPTPSRQQNRDLAHFEQDQPLVRHQAAACEPSAPSAPTPREKLLDWKKDINLKSTQQSNCRVFPPMSWNEGKLITSTHSSPDLIFHFKICK